MTARDFLAAWKRRLVEAGVDSPGLSAELILAHSLGMERADLLKSLLLDPAHPLPQSACSHAEALLQRREKGEPVAYILGEKEFYGRGFAVNPATLIPRPETELLIDQAVALAAGRAPRFADLGTGSGCIAVTLCLEIPGAMGVAIDISARALDTALANALRLGAGALTFVQADLTCPPILPGSLDLLVSNPPYVSRAEYETVSPEVRDFEPQSALVPPGGGGLELVQSLCLQGVNLLRPGGVILVEIGCEQGSAVHAMFSQSSGWEAVRILEDLAGLPRLLRAIRRS